MRSRQRHLEQLVNAVLLASCEKSRPLKGPGLPADASRSFEESWVEILEEASERAERKYRTLVEDPAFLRYFHEATPIEQLAQMNIGSRPAKRRETTDISDLRAIPWVFCLDAEPRESARLVRARHRSAARVSRAYDIAAEHVPQLALFSALSSTVRSSRCAAPT